MCNKIYNVVDYIQKHSTLTLFHIYCPVVVTTHDGIEIMTIDKDDVASSKYYKSNFKYNRNRINYTLPSINFTNFIEKNIRTTDFNVMKFDVEGEEYSIIPDLIHRNLLMKFDILYSEFHLKELNNPIQEKSNVVFNQYINYTKYYNIETYEERKISQQQKVHYSDLYNELLLCRNGLYN